MFRWLKGLLSPSTSEVAAPRPDTATPAAAPQVPGRAPDSYPHEHPGLPDERSLVLPGTWGRRLHPRRGGRYLKAMALPTGASAWAAHRSTLDKLSFRAVPADGPLASLHAEALAWLEAAEPVDTSVDVHGAAITLIEHAATYRGPTAAPFVTWLMTAHGEAYAIDALLRSRGWTLNRQRQLSVGHSHFVHHDLYARVRGYLASADESVATAVQDLLQACFEVGSYSQKVVAFFLAEDDSLDSRELVARQSHDGHGVLLLMSRVPPDALDTLKNNTRPTHLAQGTTFFVPGVVEVHGIDAEELLVDLLAERSDREGLERVAESLSWMPTDRALHALIEYRDKPGVGPWTLAGLGRYPVRALRLLSAGEGAWSQQQARVIGRQHPAAVDAVGAHLTPGDAQRLAALLAGDARAPDGTNVPPLLRNPPWERTHTPAKVPRLSKLVEETDPPTLYWHPDEREQVLAAIQPTTGEPPTYGMLDAAISHTDDAVAKEALTKVHGAYSANATQVGGLLARHRSDAVEVTHALVDKFPATLPGTLPLASADIARAVTHILSRRHKLRDAALDWLHRHPGRVALHAVWRVAAGTAKARREGLEVLRVLDEEGHTEAIGAACRRYGEDVTQAIAALYFDVDRLFDLPRTLPDPPTATFRGGLPQLILRSGGGLPDSAVANLLIMMQLGTAKRPYAGLEPALEALTPESVAAFGWALFSGWMEEGAPSAQVWRLVQLGHTGDDGAARNLAPMIREWPGESAHARAVTGLEVLGRIGTDGALVLLLHIAEKVKFKGLKAAARRKIADIGKARGLSADELADRLVPVLGLDDRGGLDLDFGARKFRVGFDAYLRPTVLHGTKLLKNLPKAGVKDDPALAAAATTAWKQLKKDVRSISASALPRLERAMCTGRVWSPDDFETHIANHPLMGHVARRLLWSTGGVPFRVTENGGFESLDDESVVLAGPVCLVHPLDLDEAARTGWAEMFADYDLLQPFDQLSRASHRLSEEEAAERALTRFEGRVVGPDRILRLKRRGWSPCVPQDNGWIPWMVKELPEGRFALLPMEPGLYVGNVASGESQTLGAIVVAPAPHPWTRAEVLMGDVDAVLVSEIIADVESLTG